MELLHLFSEAGIRLTMSLHHLVLSMVIPMEHQTLVEDLVVLHLDSKILLGILLTFSEQKPELEKNTWEPSVPFHHQ